ncbi:hypothetical protein K469DRAFT_94539 [Zopfia rhizophila CBS 207.26]|uniref:Uncharacterized protein n=1 Tax=Zopfia rhizophila CBS 207.26 TaxID=1314779 RepID=A0A6A6EB08_9PEZI|nr:hypothetical protein K469DRAFT_94539 [Zopfia rhizophila CBS 207.26]
MIAASPPVPVSYSSVAFSSPSAPKLQSAGDMNGALENNSIVNHCAISQTSLVGPLTPPSHNTGLQISSILHPPSLRHSPKCIIVIPGYHPVRRTAQRTLLARMYATPSTSSSNFWSEIPFTSTSMVTSHFDAPTKHKLEYLIRELNQMTNHSGHYGPHSLTTACAEPSEVCTNNTVTPSANRTFQRCFLPFLKRCKDGDTEFDKIPKLSRRGVSAQISTIEPRRTLLTVLAVAIIWTEINLQKQKGANDIVAGFLPYSSKFLSPAHMVYRWAMSNCTLIPVGSEERRQALQMLSFLFGDEYEYLFVLCEQLESSLSSSRETALEVSEERRGMNFATALQTMLDIRSVQKATRVQIVEWRCNCKHRCTK